MQRSRAAANASRSRTLIVLGGCAAVEQAAKQGGHAVHVPFTPDAAMPRKPKPTSRRSRRSSRSPMVSRNFEKELTRTPGEAYLLDKAQLLTLTAPELTVLVGGLRVLGANAGGSTHGVLTQRPAC